MGISLLRPQPVKLVARHSRTGRFMLSHRHVHRRGWNTPTCILWRVCALQAADAVADNDSQRLYHDLSDNVQLGNTSLNVSKICLGTMQFGEGLSHKQGYKQMSYVFERGVNFFDTAEMYPIPQNRITQGDSERCLGAWVRNSNIKRDAVNIATKVTGPSAQMEWIRDGPATLDASAIVSSVEDSLTRLGTDYIDLLQLHWPDRYVPMFGNVDFDPTYDYCSHVPIEEQLEALAKVVAQGKVREVGLSNETPWGLMKFAQRAQAKGAGVPRIASVQNCYNLLCRTFDSTLAECCHREKISLLAYSPLAMGHLSGKYLGEGLDAAGSPNARLNKYKGRYAEGESRYSFLRPNLMSAVREYDNLAKLYGISTTELAFRFVSGHPLVSSTIIGATNVRQLEEILNASVAGPLCEEILHAIDQIHCQYPNPAP